MPIFTAIAGAFAAVSSFIGGLGAIGSFVLKTAVGIGLNLLAKAIAGKPEGPKFEIKGKIQGGGDVPRSFALGWAATAGSLVYQNEWGQAGKTPNAYTTRVIALFDLPVGELVQVMINGQYVTLGDMPDPDMGYPVLEYRKGGRDFQWVKFYDGTQTVADPFLVGKVSSVDRPYEETRVGTGVAYAVCTSLLDQELYTGFPEYKFSVNGTKWYDPSKDTTVGGAGSHRRNNPATWGGDGDHFPAVQIYNLLLGISFGGHWFYGLQNTAPARVPVANFIDQIAKCRASIAGPDGDQPTYRTGGEIPVSSPVADTITALLTGCQGRLAEFGGTYDLHVGAPAEPSFSISDDDILSSEEQSFTPFYGLSDTINGIAAKCPDPAQLWNVKVLPPLYNTDYEAEDGNRRLLADVSLDLVPYVAQGQMLQKSALAEARRARRHTYVLPPKFWAKAVPNSTFTWTSARNGYVTKRFRIDGAADKANLDNLVDITEIDPTDFYWDFDTDFHPMPDGPVGPIRPPVQAMTGWQVFPAALPDADGVPRRPSIGVRFDGDLDDVQFVQVQVRIAATGALWFDSSAISYGDPATNPDPKEVILNGVFAPNTDYEARGIYLPFSGRGTEWSSWLPVKTDDIRLGANDIYEGLVDEIIEHTDEMMAPLRAIDLRQMYEDARSNALAAMKQDAGQYEDIQRDLVHVRSVFEEVTADYQSLVEVKTGPGSTLARRQDVLEASIGGFATATALSETVVRVTSLEDTTTIYGARLDLIEATLPGKASASALSLLEATVTNQGNTITAQGNAITAVSSELTTTKSDVSAAQNAAQAASDLAGGKGKVIYGSSAPATADRQSQNLWIDTTGNANTPKRWNGSTWAAVTDKVATDAAAAAADALNQVATKASATALNSLSTTVTNQGNTLSAQGTLLSGVQADVGKVSASGLMRSKVVATESGASSTVGIYSAASAGEGTTRESAVLLSAIANNKSMIGFVADVVYITDNAGNRKYPFIFSGGVLRAYQMRIGFALIDDVQITGDLIVNGSIDSPSLKQKSVTDYNSGTFNHFPTTDSGTWVTVSTFSVSNPAGNIVDFFFEYEISASGGGNTERTASIRFLRGGAVINSRYTESITAPAGSGTVNKKGAATVFDFAAPTGTLTYSCQIRCVGLNTSTGGVGSIGARVYKR